MDLGELETIIKTRRSVRKWQDKKVPEDLITQAIELATWAPSGGNAQNWKFYAVFNKNVIKQLADAAQKVGNQIVTWPEAKQIENVQRYANVSSFGGAPVLIVIAAAQYQSPVDKLLEAREKNDPLGAEIRKARVIADSKIQGVASFIAHFLLIIHKMGLGGVWMTGPVMAKAEFEKILKVPKDLDVVAMIPVGYPSESPVARPRKPLKDVCEIIR